jgi:hypothetical protein
MAQHDYNLANQSGADFRADLNNALSAIVTVNSGASAPSTTFAHQLWVDTSSNVLKIRNAANDAWVTTGLSITADNTFDINGGTVNGITALSFSTGASVTSILDEDNLGSDSATALATQQSIKAYVDSQIGSVDTLAEILLNGNTTGGTDIAVGDNDKAIFGTGSDLQIFHDGSNSFIKEVGTGDLRILASAKIDFRSNDDATVMIRANAGGSVDLRYAGDRKLETTSSGISVTGTATMDGLTVDGDATLSDANPTLSLVDTTATNQGAEFAHNAGTTTIKSSNTSTHGVIKFNSNNGTDTVTRMEIDRFGDISFYDDTGTSQNLKWDASADSLNFVDNAKATFGASNDLEIYHDGSASYIKDVGTGNLLIQAETSLVLEATNGQNYLTANKDGNVSLYYSGSNKLYTTNTGINITGTVTSDGLTSLGDTQVISFASDSGYLKITNNIRGGDYRIATSGTTAQRLELKNGNSQKLIRFADNGDISFYDDTGSTQGLFWDASAESLGIGTTSPTEKLTVQNGIQRINSTDGSSDARIQFSMTNGSDIPTAWVGIPSWNKDAFYIFAPTATGNESAAFYTNANWVFQTGGTEALRIDSSQRVGIGTSSPARELHIEDSGAVWLQMTTTNTSTGTVGLLLGDTNATTKTRIVNDATDNLQFWTGTSESGRFDSSGNLLVGKTSTATANVGIELRNDGLLAVTRDTATVAIMNRNTNGTIIDFRKSDTSVGSVSTAGGTTSYNTSSDARLKDITGEARGLEVITKLNPVAYNWKADGKADEGLIAQEVKEIVPNAVSGSEDEHYQMDYSKLVTPLVKAVQELEQQVTKLKSEIAKLKGE